MSNFKIPVTPLFDGDQFELQGDVIKAKSSGGSLNIRISLDPTSGKYECSESFATISTAIASFQDINIKFPTTSGISYDGWSIKDSNTDSIVFSNGYYTNTVDTPTAWVEQSITMSNTYVSGATLELVENVVHSRTPVITYSDDTTIAPTYARYATFNYTDNKYKLTKYDLPEVTSGGEFGGWYYDLAHTRKANIGDEVTRDGKLYVRYVPAAVGLAVTANEPNVTVALTTNNSYEYTTDGANWNTYTSTTPITLADIGEEVQFRATSDGQNATGDKFSISGKFGLRGNVMYLINQNGSGDTISTTSRFASLFYTSAANDNDGLQNIAEGFLPAKTLSASCYSDMFSAVSGVVWSTNPVSTEQVTIPAGLLPANTAGASAYYKMFAGRNITSLPDGLLQVQTATGNGVYSYMFSHCKQLTKVGNIFKNTLNAYKENICKNMFGQCAALNDVSKDLFKDKFLAQITENGAFYNMFTRCTALTVAPDLYMYPAYTYLDCYKYMFDTCSSLNSVTVKAEDWNNTDSRFLDGVAATGTFYSTLPQTKFSSGTSGVPTGWTFVSI